MKSQRVRSAIPAGGPTANFSRQAVIVILHALIGWALCAAVMGIAMAVTSLQIAFVVHAAAAPVIFAAISTRYFKRYEYPGALVIATAFVGIVVLMDVTIVAMLVNHSFEMFTSFAGTWLPLALIFGSSYLTGRAIRNYELRKGN